MIAKALRLIRQYHHLNQANLAKGLSISVSYVSDLESGKKEPSLEDLQKYADFFKVSLSSLVIFSDTLSEKYQFSKTKILLSRKMLKILDWIADSEYIKKRY